MLRSFNEDLPHEGPESLIIIDDFITFEKGSSILSTFAEVANYHAPVLVVGKMHFGSPWELSYCVEIESPEKKWEKNVNTLLSNCRNVLIIPAISEGVIKEMKMISAEPTFLQKTVVFIPPPIYTNEVHSNSFDLYDHWESVRKKLSEHKFNIPEYGGVGRIYIPNKDFSPKENLFMRYSTKNINLDELNKLFIQLIDKKYNIEIEIMSEAILKLDLN